MRAKRLVDVVEQRHVDRFVQPTGLQMRLEELLGFGDPALGEGDRLVFFVLQEVPGGLELLPLLGRDVPLGDGTRLEPRDDPIDLVVEFGRLFRGT